MIKVVGAIILSVMALTACQSQETDSSKIGVHEASATINFFGVGARMLELDAGHYDVYALAPRATSTTGEWYMNVKIRRHEGLWTELIAITDSAEKDVLIGTSDLEIEESGLYVLYGDTNHSLWWTIDMFRR